MKRFSGPRPPVGASHLNDYLAWVGACHEAGHAVAAYHLRYPHKAAYIRLPIRGTIEDAHLERDHEAVEIGRQYLRGQRANEARMLLIESMTFEMGRAVNVLINDVPNEEANSYASDDHRFLDESFRMSQVTREVYDWVKRTTLRECKRLALSQDGRAAIESVADALISAGGYLREDTIRQVIESRVGASLKNQAREPMHAETALAAYYYWLLRGPDSDPITNWLTAERGVRFGIASLIVD